MFGIVFSCTHNCITLQVTHRRTSVLRLGYFCGIAAPEEPTRRIFLDSLTKVSDEVWPSGRAVQAATYDGTVEPFRTIENLPLIRVCCGCRRSCELSCRVSYCQPPNGFPLHQATAGMGSPIVISRNLAPPKMCNGTRMVVKHLRGDLMAATILTSFEDLLTPRIALLATGSVFPSKRTANAITVHRSQGQTLKVAGLYLAEPCCLHGQFM